MRSKKYKDNGNNVMIVKNKLKSKIYKECHMRGSNGFRESINLYWSKKKLGGTNV